MTPQEIQAAAEAALAEQTRQAQERAREAQKAIENAKYERDCIVTARR
ncbi:hypothetical protein GCM10011583_18250 [Streptomyces camponoticapitis]|uniref:Uncharacterized protein n=1 Tax=Streptomyces camponoticapitis TaxID=1616125 RepID=A0ABQ2E3W8_9ACTN|nr:hypothetical protein GCM10011583_18250 [Streptomyces camponoticapitis]